MVRTLSPDVLTQTDPTQITEHNYYEEYDLKKFPSHLDTVYAWTKDIAHPGGGHRKIQMFHGYDS